MNFDAFFENLPFVPMIDVCKHLRPIQVISCFLISERWERAIEQSGSRSHLGAHLAIHTESNSCAFTMKLLNAKTDHFTISLQNFCAFGGELDCGMSPVGQWHQRSPSFFFYPYSFQIYTEKLENVHEKCVEVMEFMCKVFRPTTDTISLTATGESLDFTDKLISLIPSGEGYWFEIKGEEVVIKGETIRQLLERTAFCLHVFIGLELDQVFASDKMNLKACWAVKCKDARFLSRNNLLNMKFREGEFGINTFTSQDFNAFLKNWKEYRVINEASRLREVRFAISDNQRIDLEDVLEGLDARPWDPTVRDRVLWQYTFDPDKVLDFKDDLDLENVGGALGTIRLTDNQLLFIIWEHRFPIIRQENGYMPVLERRLKKMEGLQKKLEEVEKKLEGDKENEELISDKKKCEEDIIDQQEWIDDVREYLDNLRKLK